MFEINVPTVFAQMIEVALYRIASDIHSEINDEEMTQICVYVEEENRANVERYLDRVQEQYDLKYGYH